MKFASVAQALKWFFNKRWRRPPSDARSIDLINVKSTFRATAVEREILFFLTIQRVLEAKINSRQYVILLNEFRFQRKTQTEIAHEMDLSGDRSVRRIRDKAIKKLEEEFMDAGILSNPRRERPVYAHN